MASIFQQLESQSAPKEPATAADVVGVPGPARPVVPLSTPTPVVQSAPPPPVTYRDFGDSLAVRKAIFDKTLESARRIKPVTNALWGLHLTDVDYEDPDDFPIARQKEAILKGESLSRRLRGTWSLMDKDGKLVEQKRSTIAQVPYLSPRGTFIIGGSEYTLKHQMRLRSGVFTRRKENGELESHANIMPGKGLTHHYALEPETGVFKMNIAQASLPLYPILKHVFGLPDSRLRKEFGNELWEANARKDDPRVVDKLYQKFVKRGAADASPEDKAAAVKAAFEKMEFDPEVNNRTLGKGHTHLDAETMLATTRKLLAVNRGESEGDDRDDLSYQTFLGPEDLISERLDRVGSIMNPLLWKAGTKGTLKTLPVNAFDRHVRGSILDSGLGLPLEEINPLDVFDQQTAVTRLGTGGIGSLDAVPTESRNVHPSQTGFVDLLRTPESLKVGVDSRISYAARKGSDGRLYSPFLNVKTGKTEYKSPQDVSALTLAFPQEMESGDPMVQALVGGRTRYVPREKVDMVMPHPEQWFSPITNLVPNKSTIKGQRVAMGSRFSTQALSLVNAQAPLVRGQLPGQVGMSFEEHYGKHVGAVFAKDQPGRVAEVSPNEITVKYADGTVEKHPTYDHFPYNRKSHLHNTPMVKPGDPVQPKQILAKSNFTDDKGHVAVGTNLRVAYLPFRGLNYEDAWAISESAAKILTSEHMYQHELQFDPKLRKGKKSFVSIFPSKFDKKTIDTLDDHGVIKPGAVVKPGDPLILAAVERDLTHKSVHAAHKGSFSDRTVLWDHHNEGVVTDVAMTPKGVVVAVKSVNPTQVGDKLCYDPETELLTMDGWKRVGDATLEDRFASLTPDGRLEYVDAMAVSRYSHDGKMYRLSSQMFSLLVTPNHSLYAARRPDGEDHFEKKYSLITADELFGTTYRMCKRATWLGKTPEVPFGVPKSTFIQLLGLRLSNPVPADYALYTQDLDPEVLADLYYTMEADGVDYNTMPSAGYVSPSNDAWDRFTQTLDRSEPRIPAEVFGWLAADAALLVRWMLRCGTVTGGDYILSAKFATTSKGLADDFQRLLLHAGMSGSIDTTPEHWETRKGKAYWLPALYTVKVDKKNVSFDVGLSYPTARTNELEEWVDYAGEVYCVSLPRNHVLFARRDGKAVWCGNSGRYGDKGVVSKIIPDDEMPRGADGQPYHLLANPLGVTSRCYDEETEFYTDKGWCLGIDVRETDSILCFDPKTFTTVWHKQVAPMYSAEYRGDMLLCETNRVNFLVTPDHKVWSMRHSDILYFTGDGAPEWEETTAEASSKYECQIPVPLQLPKYGSTRLSGDVAASRVATAAWSRVTYDGLVFCPTVPTGYVVSRRKGKMVCLGNTNPGQKVEGWLGKIALLTGKPYVVEDFSGEGKEDVTDWAHKQLQKHGLEAMEDVEDPTSGHKVKVNTGIRYFMKLHHTAEGKHQGRGLGGYTAEDAPARGGDTGCFVPSQEILTIDGPVRISKICEKRLRVPVRTYDASTRTWTYRPVIDWFTRRASVDDIVVIHQADGRCISATKNHLLYRPDGTRFPAGRVEVGTELATWGPQLTDHQWQFLLGCMLGDGSLNDNVFSCEHSVKQVEYLNWKQSVLSGLGSTTYTRDKRRTPSTIRGVQVNSSSSCIVSLSASHVWNQLSELCCRPGSNYKTVSRVWLDQIGGLGVVVWLLDDGSITNRAKKVGQVSLSGNLATHGFNNAERELIASWLREKYGAGCSTTEVGSINLSALLCQKLIDEVAEWVPWKVIPKSKRFLRNTVKVLQEQRPAKSLNTNSKLGLVPVRVIGVTPYVPDKPGLTEINVYDITVEETHNYCAGHTLVSNSKRLALMDVNALLSHGACFTSGTGVLTRGGYIDIASIVDQRLNVEVACSNGRVVTYARVVDWFKREVPGSEIMTVEAPARYGPGGREDVHAVINCTKGHEFYTEGGKIQAAYLEEGTRLFTAGTRLTARQRQLVVGTVLGNGCWDIGRVPPEHRDQHYKHLEWKYGRLKNLHGHTPYFAENTSFTLRRSVEMDEILKSFAARPGNKLLEEGEGLADMLGMHGLGILAAERGGWSARSRSRMSFNISVPTLLEKAAIKLAADLSDRLGITWSHYLNAGKYPILKLFGDEELEVWKSMITPFFPPELGYKLRDEPCGAAWDGEESDAFSPSVPGHNLVEPTAVKRTYPCPGFADRQSVPVYDITVETHHNYFVNGILVGNTSVLRDAKLIRGQKNQEYWSTFMSGFKPATPGVPTVYRKFIDQLRASGVNVQRKGSQLHLMALTDRDIDQMAENRELENVDTVDWKNGLKPVKGGLFDTTSTGGHGGSKWSYIKLHEPMPNPVMEEPIRKLLRITGKEYEEVLAGRAKLDGRTGSEAIRSALAKINVEKAIETAREEVKGGRKGARDEAIKRLGYLKAAFDKGIHPREWVLNKVPVLPPAFRPVSMMQGGNQLISDANYLYKEVWDANKNLKDLSGKVDDTADERLTLYKAFKAVTGLGDPVQPKNQERQVKGMLQQVFGDSPKFGCFDDATEILTRDGWVAFPDLPEGVDVATLHPETGVFEWQVPSGVFHWDYKGDMFWFGTKRGLDCLVTPNHRNWVRRRTQGRDDMETGWAIERAYLTAADRGRKWFRTAASGWEGHRILPAFLPEGCPATDFASLVGWWAAEGWLAHDGKTVQICQSVDNTEKCEEISRVLSAAGFRYSTGRYEDRGWNDDTTVLQWSIFSPELADWLVENVSKGASTKSLTPLIKGWDTELLRAFLLAYLDGDGTRRYEPRRNNGGVTHKNHSNLLDRHQNCHSTSRKLADDIVEIACKLGITGRVKLQRDGDDVWKPLWRVNLSGSRFVVMEGAESHKVVEYEGRVHCVSVPNGIVYVRRSGKPFFSGNTVQQKLLGTTMDLVGRAVVAPNPDLSIDEVGLPESRAWEVYAPFIIRRLVKKGVGRIQAMEYVTKKNDLAKKALLEELDARPLMVNRAPVLHRYGRMAFYPRLVKGDVLQICPLVVGGFGMDFDGDASNYEVIADDDAAQEAIQKMLPSRNLIGVSSLKNPMYTPRQEYVGGLWSATSGIAKDKRSRTFATVKDALQAYWRGEHSPDDPVDVME